MAGCLTTAASNWPNGAPGERAKRIVLLAHADQVLHFAIAGGKMIVPHQRQAFAERIGRARACDRATRLSASRHCPTRWPRHRWCEPWFRSPRRRPCRHWRPRRPAAVGRAASVRWPAVDPRPGRGARSGPRGRRRRAAMQMDDAGEIPGCRLGRLVSGPGGTGIGVCLKRGHEGDRLRKARLNASATGRRRRRRPGRAARPI